MLQHQTRCQSGQSCQEHHCPSTREILIHWKDCTHNGCPVCKPFKKPVGPTGLLSVRPIGPQGGPSLDVPQAGPSSFGQGSSQTDQILDPKKEQQKQHNSQNQLGPCVLSGDFGPFLIWNKPKTTKSWAYETARSCAQPKKTPKKDTKGKVKSSKNAKKRKIESSDSD